jgi:hypothetical protein
MSLKIPRNIIIEAKYTQGKEYMTIDTYKEYQGYYYELNDKIFAGKEFDVFAPELIRLSSNKINPLLTRLSTYAYAALSQKQNDILSTIIFIYVNYIPGITRVSPAAAVAFGFHHFV